MRSKWQCAMTGRSTAEWIGATPAAKIPDRVLLRIFRNADGICHISGRRIEAGDEWHAEHVVPLSMGGRHRESNLRPALIEPHKDKSAEEAAARAKADAVAKRHVGITRPVAKLKSAPFAKSERTANRQPRAPVSGPPGIARRFQEDRR